MAKLHGSKGVLYLDDVAGACQQLTADIQSVTFTRSKNNPDATTMGEGTLQRVDGLRDVGYDVTAVFNSQSVGYDTAVALLDKLWADSVVTRVQWLPAGSVSGCPIYTASMRMNNYAHNQPVDGIATLTFGLENGAGSMTAACVA